MRPSSPVSVPLFILVIIVVLILTAGCIGGHRLAVTDIQVSKFDSGGQKIWSTKIDSGKQDYATAITQTSDSGFVISGWIADDPRSTTHPRVIRIDETGGILWDRILDSRDDEAIAIAKAHDGGFIVALKSGELITMDDSGLPVGNRTFDFTIKSLIPTRDGGFALVGEDTVRLDGNGSPVWDLPYPSTSILQAADGGFFVERSGVPYNNGELSRLDENGTVIWTRTVGSHEMGKITSLHETREGTVEVMYTYPDRTKDKDLVMFMESEQITFEDNGTISSTMPLVAVDPVTRTSDEGYVFAAYPFPGSTAFTSFPHADSTLHLVRLSSQGVIVWQRSLDLPKWVAPRSIIQTRDGGFVTLVVPGS